MYLSDSVCLSVCLQNISKSYERIFLKFCGEMERGSGRNGLDSGGDLDSFVDPGSFSEILYHQQIACKLTFFKLETDFNNIFWRGGVWP